MLRREFLRNGAGAAFMMFGLEALPANVFAEGLPQPDPFFIEADRNDPVFKAATVALSTRNEQDQSFSSKGGIVRYQGNLGILTVNHAIQNKNQLRFRISDMALARMNDDILRACQEQAGESDRAVFMPMPKDYAILMEEFAKANIFSPLRITTSKVAIGDLVAQPNSATGYDLFEVKKIFSRQAELLVESPSFVPVCKGKSGTPLLKVSESEVLPEVVGVVQSFPADTRLSTDESKKEYSCGMSLILSATWEL